MLLTERINSFVDAVRSAIIGETAAVANMLPVIIQGQSDGHTTSMQSAINAMVRKDDGTLQSQQITPFEGAPVHFMGGGGWTNTHAIANGDEGVGLFMDRNQDGWHANGGIQDPIDLRSNHFSDARFLPGGRSDPRKLNPAPSTSSNQSRSDDGNHVYDGHPSNGLTSASTAKVQHISGQSQSTTTPTAIIKTSPKLTMNCSGGPPGQPPGLTMIQNMQPSLMAPPAAGPMASSIISALTSVLTGGASAVLTDPTAAPNTTLSASAISGATALTGALGGAAAPMVAAMTGAGGLTSALSTLATGTGALSGVTATGVGAPYSLTDLMNHATMAHNYFGASPPSSVSFSAAAGPLMSGPTLTSYNSQLNSVVSQVIAGSMTVAAGTTAVNAMNTALSALMPASSAAIGALQTAAPALAMVANAGAAVISMNPLMSSLGAVMAPVGSALATLGAAMGAVSAPTAGESAAMTSFPDSSAAQQGATGGVA